MVALGDGTLRWYRMRPHASPSAAALFVHATSRRWVAWTPEGLFDHAPNGGQELVGVHLNGGRSSTPEWASFQQAYRALYAPAAVRARIAGDRGPACNAWPQLGDAARAHWPPAAPWSRASACAVTEAGCTPVAFDALSVPAGSTALRLGFTATDRGLGFGPLDILVNDRIAAAHRAQRRGASPWRCRSMPA